MSSIRASYALPISRNYIVALAMIVIVALAGGLYSLQAHSNAVNHRNQVAGCERGNVIRQTLHDFLHEAARSRLTLARLNAGKIRRENIAAAHRYGVLYRKFRVLDCEKAYPKP